MDKFEHLLQPLQVKSMLLTNRVVMPPVTTMLAGRDYCVSEANIAHLGRIAGSGAGLIIAEVAAVHPDGIEGPGMLGVYDDRFIEGLGRLASAVQKKGARVMAQIYHVGRESQYQLEQGRAVAPSASAGIFGRTPRAMDRGDIQEVIAAFGSAAVRVRKAGFDGVEIHAAHGYLPMQFLSRLSNHRRDEYGGEFRNRARFIVEVVAEVRRQVGDDFPISIRISAEECVPDGYTCADMQTVVPLFVEAGIDIIHTSFGTQSTPGGISCAPIEYEAGFHAHLAAGMKEVTNIPVIAVGRFTSPAQAEKIISRGDADLVAFGRQHLADPFFLQNALAGKEEETIECLACNQGCLDRLYRGRTIRCAINPLVGQELTYPDKAVGRCRKVLVIGAGPAGLTAACEAARLGHKVILLEKADTTGGQVRLAAQVPYKGVYGRWINKLTEKVKKAGAEIRLSVEADLTYIKREKPDVVILAAGARSIYPAVHGIDRSHVFLASQVLEGKTELTDHVLIIGGGLVGMETADYLRARGVGEIYVLERQHRSPVKKSNGHAYLLHRRFNEAGYHLYLGSELIKIEADKAIIKCNSEEKILRLVKQIILAAGSSPTNELQAQLEQEGISFYSVGDAKKNRRIMEAVEEGARAAWEIR